MKLNRTPNPLDRNARNGENENWDIIEGEVRAIGDRVDNFVDEVSEDAYNKLVEDARLDWREMVDEYSDLPTNARKGTTVGVKEQGIIYRYNGNSWDRLFEINLNPISEVDARLTSQLNDTDEDLNSRGVNIKSFGAKGDFDETSNTGTDDFEAFKAASQYAKENNVKIHVPEGNYKIGGHLEIFDSLVGDGILYFPNDNTDAKIKISSKQTPIDVDINAIGGLFEGSTKIEGLLGYANHTLVIESDEILIPRYNPPNNTPYTKNEVAVVTDNQGGILPSLDFDYEKNKVSRIFLIPQEKRLIVEVGLRGYGDSVKNTHLLSLERSNVLFSRYESHATAGTVNTHVAINNCALVEFYNTQISNAQMDGFGYGISIGNSAFTILENCNIYDCRHTLSGRHGKSVTVNGGNYAGDIDTHWGSGYVILNAKIKNRVLYAGRDIHLENNVINSEWQLLAARQDTPEIYGVVSIIRNKIKSRFDNNYFALFTTPIFQYPQSFDFGRTLRSPEKIEIVENVIDCEEPREVRMINSGGMGGLKYQPPREITINNNMIVNKNTLKLDLPFNDDLESDFNVSKVRVENQGMFGASYADRNVTIADKSTEDLGFLYSITFINCESLAFAIDETTFEIIRVKDSTANYLSRVANKTPDFEGDGLIIDGCILENCSIGYRHQPYRLVNTEMKGQMSIATTNNLKASIGSYALSGTTGLPGQIDFFNYLSS